jgi:ATP-dependent DNA ligase
MLATAGGKPFTSPYWLYNIKYDGYRCMARGADGAAELARQAAGKRALSARGATCRRRRSCSSGAVQPLLLEGFVAKRRTSSYQPGVRSPDWLKIKRKGAVPPERFKR